MSSGPPSGSSSGVPPGAPRASGGIAPRLSLPQILKGKVSLSRDLSDFLIEMSITIGKHGMYPPGHPLLVEAVERVLRKLGLLLVDRPSISIGVARRQLIIEGVATDPKHPLLRELAGRLHKQTIGAVKFLQEVTREELGDALATVALDSDRAGESLWAKAEELSERWAHIRLFSLNYDQLELLYEGKDTEGEERVHKASSSKAAQLWVGMARAAMMLEEDTELDAESADPMAVAEAIDKHQEEQAYDQVIVGYMLQIAEELKQSGGQPEAIELQKRISDMVKELSQKSLKKLLQMGGDVAQRRQFLLNASQGMNVGAVLALVNAATAPGTQTISHSMMRLFFKLSRFAETDSDATRRENADASMREQMGKLISEWKLDDPNPTAYGKALQKMSRTGVVVTNNAYMDCEPERILEMGFELSVGGSRFDVALDALLQSARFDELLKLIDNAPDPEYAEGAWAYLDSHDILQAALSEARLDFGVLERIVRRKRLSAIEPILDLVERTNDASMRERLWNMVIALGNDVGPLLARRIDTSRPELRRDFFLLLGKLSTVPEGFDVARYLVHTDAQVRREAVRLLLMTVETRERGIVAGIADSDDRVVFMALTAAMQGGCPPKGVDVVRKRIANGDLDSSLMTLAIRVLAAADGGAGPKLQGKGRTSQMLKALDTNPSAIAAEGKKTFDWLVGKVVYRTRFRRKLQLKDKSPEMLAALGALAAYWGGDPNVQEIIQLVLKSGDPELKKALGAQRTTGKFKAITDQ